MAMDTQTAGNSWAELVGQWQAMSRQWMQWWSGGDASPAPAAPMSIELGNAALAVLAPTDAWIDPAAAAELTEGYNRRLEALWQRAFTGDATPGSQQGAVARAADRRFAAK